LGVFWEKGEEEETSTAKDEGEGTGEIKLTVSWTNAEDDDGVSDK
jgi:hypothetical protein